MADSDKTLKLLIELGVIGKEDVQAANGLLAETASTASNTAKATTELGHAEKGTAEHAEHLHLNHRALHKIMHMIGKETAPELGVALNAAFIGPLAMAVAAGVAVEKLSEHIKKTNEELEKMSDKAAEAFNNIKANLFDALRAEEFSTEKVDKFFKHIDDQADETKRKIENALALTREEGSAQLEKNKADEAAQIEYVKKKFASIMPSGKGTTEEREELKRQEEEQINAIKDKFAKENAILKVQGEQAGVTAAEAIYRSLQAELNKLLMQRGPGGEKTDRQKAEREANITSVDQELESIKSKLGMDEKTGLPSGEGDLKRLETLKKKYGSQLEAFDERNGEQMAQLREKLEKGVFNAPGFAPGAEKRQVETILRGLEQQRAAIENKSGIAQAEAAVEADKKRIEQLKDQAAALKQTADADKKLQEEIEKFIIKVREAREAMEQAASIAGIKAEATFYAVDKNAQHGRDIQGVSDFRPRPGAANLDQMMTIVQYSEAQKQKVIESILNHSVTSAQAWNSFAGRIAWLEQQMKSGRNRPQG